MPLSTRVGEGALMAATRLFACVTSNINPLKD